MWIVGAQDVQEVSNCLERCAIKSVRARDARMRREDLDLMVNVGTQLFPPFISGAVACFSRAECPQESCRTQ